MTELVIQIGVILFAVRIGGRFFKAIGIPTILGELLAGVLIGPYALGGIALPGLPGGIFPINEAGALAVSPELYAFATVASIILLFASGLETNLGLFLRYSVAGGIIGFCGILVSFTAGLVCASILLNAPLIDPRCLFLGVIASTTSVGITVRILSDHKRMDSPEGVTMLAASVFDGVLWIVLLTVALGIVAILTGRAEGVLSAPAILRIAGKAFGIWLGVTILGLICSKLLAAFLKFFKHSYDFSILAFGIALILAGLFEQQGLAMVIGAYIAGLSLSRTDIAAIIQERIRGLYDFFVPIFFAVMGMMVNVREILSVEVLIFSLIFTLVAILAKIIGAGGPALLLGFNYKGSLRIGMGMIPRGEEALITAGIGLSAGILSNQLFSIVVFMILLTILTAPVLFNFMIKIQGQGTRKTVKDEDSVQEIWEFESDEIADLVMNNFLKELRAEGFYVQMMNLSDGLSQARKDDIVIFIIEKDNSLTIKTSKIDMPFVKNEIYEVILDLSHHIQRLKNSADPAKMKKDLLNSSARTTKDILSLIDTQCFNMNLRGETKGDIIIELVDILASADKLMDRDQVLADVIDRELSMSTGMEHGVAIPHGKTDGVTETAIAVGVKKSGIQFDSMDGQSSRIFILVVSPRKACGLHVEFLAAIGSILGDENLREAVINSDTAEEAASLLLKR